MRRKLSAVRLGVAASDSGGASGRRIHVVNYWRAMSNKQQSVANSQLRAVIDFRDTYFHVAAMVPRGMQNLSSA